MKDCLIDIQFEPKFPVKMMSLGSLVILFALLQVNVHGRCVMRGNCGTDAITYLNTPCTYNGDALPLVDTDAINFLKDVCPSLKTGPDFAVCCDSTQVKDFQAQLSALEVLFKRCPSCYHNLANVFCQLVCSPTQNLFLEVTNFTPSPAGNSVSEMSYFITENFARGLFNSCKNVKLASTTTPAIEITCGSYMTDCDPHLWLQFMGGHDPSPYQINFQFETADNVTVNKTVFYPMNETTIPCSESPKPGSVACSCVDCPCLH